MTTFVLVHGAFHGGWCWKKLRPILTAAGHDVFTPTMTGLGERAHLHDDHIDLHTHTQDIAVVLEYEDLHDVVLVGHSYAGYIIALVAEQMPERIRHLVFLDAMIPVDGEAMRETYRPNWERAQPFRQAPGDAWWCPWSVAYTGDYGLAAADLAWLTARMTPHPMRTWLTPVSLKNPAAKALPHTYIMCVGKGAARSLADAAVMRQRLEPQGWGFAVLDTGHDAMISQPDELAALLLGAT
ncbi:MAG: alpha/beta fold hydrolase [Anaerolineae bacterium]|nr:alpha/beta fold hydrolase [Anaerolineae bacterium]